MVLSESTGGSSAPTPPTVSVAISELEVLKLILEFLEHRRLHIAQLALERETGLINGQYTDDVLFLRQLILDGQWDSALDFVEPLKELEGFQARNYRFLITKYKYFELLCIKQEPGPLQDNEFTVEEIVECLRELERLCESGEEFRQLCALLTLPKLSDHEHFRNWNPSSARVECFHAVLPIVADYIDRLNPPKEQQAQNEQTPEHSESERLLQLLVKGLLYESAVDYCQAQALEGKNAPKPKCKFTKLLAHRGKLSPADLSLISWLEVLGNEQFTTPFQQKTLDFRLDPLKKPKLEAQWTEQILATPIKPGGQFPYSLVPHTKLKSAQKQLLMSQSMSASMAFEPGFHGPRQRSSSRPPSYPMSQSTFPSITAFSIQQLNIDESEGKGRKALGEDVMRQSQIISDMLSESSAPSTARRSSLSMASDKVGNEANSARDERERHIDKSKSLSLASSPPISTGEGAAAARQELDAFTRRNQLQPLPLNQQRGAATTMAVNPSMAAAVPVLPSVPEMSTPGGTGALPTAFPQQPLPAEIPPHMVQSRLFQEFQASRQQQQVQAVQQQPQFPMAHPQMVYMPIQQQQHDFPMQYPPVYQMPSAAGFSMPPIAEHYVPQQNQHFQPVHPPQVMMRQHSEVPFSQNNYVPPAPPMSSRPTSMIIPPNQMQHSMMAQGQPNAGRPRSFLDQPFPPAPEQSQQPSAATSYSMMTTMPAGDHRKGSLGDEEFPPDRGTGQNSNESAGVDEPTHNNGDGTPKPLQFVPICRYEDAQAIRAVAFHPSGGHFAIGTNSRKLLLCRYPELNGNRRAVQEEGTPPPPEMLLTRPKHHRGSVYCAAFSQTGELLATGSNDKTIRLLAVQMDSNRCRIGAELELQHVHDGTVRDLIFIEERLSAGGTPSSVLISGGAGNCQLCVTDCAVGRTMKAFQGHTAPILGLNSWGSSTNFVSCSQDKTIRFWDLRASSATSIIWPTERTSMTSVYVDPSGKLLVSGHEDASIMLFDICGGRPVQLFRPHGDEVRTVRLSNAAYYLLSGSYDKRIVITDMRGNLAEPLSWLPVAEHGDKVIQCRWHPRDFLFLSTSADKSAVLWSLPAQ